MDANERSAWSPLLGKACAELGGSARRRQMDKACAALSGISRRNNLAR